MSDSIMVSATDSDLVVAMAGAWDADSEPVTGLVSVLDLTGDRLEGIVPVTGIGLSTSANITPFGS